MRKGVSASRDPGVRRGRGVLVLLVLPVPLVLLVPLVPLVLLVPLSLLRRVRGRVMVLVEKHDNH